MSRTNTEYKTEKRKANVGDRVLITNADSIAHEYKNGDVGEVYDHCDMFDDLVYVKEWTFAVRTDEYEVIVEEITQTPTHNENLVLTRLFNAEAEIDELKAKVEALEAENKDVKNTLIDKVDEYYRSPYFRRLRFPYTPKCPEKADKTKISPIPQQVFNEIFKTPTRTANQRRADVIKQAEEFVEDLLAEVDGQLGWRETYIPTYADWGRLRIEFVINKEKRTVVALARLGNIPEDTEVVGKGIAQCTTDDVFNADIGKAIALGRALGVDIPGDFTDAPQPTEPVVGMRARVRGNSIPFEDVICEDDGWMHSIGKLRRCPENLLEITDDTEAVYE